MTADVSQRSIEGKKGDLRPKTDRSDYVCDPRFRARSEMHSDPFSPIDRLLPLVDSRATIPQSLSNNQI